MDKQTYVESKLSALRSSGTTIGELCRKANINPALLFQFRQKKKNLNPLHAVDLELASQGEIKVEVLAPEFVEKLKKIGFSRQTAA